jgi:LacI family transcriptional regulator
MVTITDVAAKAGVSRATVSYVLNERNTAVRISQDTRQRVLETAEALGYHRNALARAVTTGKNHMLGFWVMQTNREPVVRLLSGAMKEADQHGYFIKVLGFDNSTLDRRIIEQCIEWRLSGIIAIHVPESSVDALQPGIVASGIPIVVVDSQRAFAGGTHVASDGATGIRQVMEHLIAQGHQKIVFIAGEPEGDTISQIRIASYAKAMEDAGLSTHQKVLYGEWDPEQTEHAVRDLLDVSETRPTAIACASDQTAMVVIRTAVQMGIRVPQELSVTGFDNVTSAALYNPPLTTVAQSFEEMGAIAVRHLLTQVESKNGLPDAPLESLLSTRLIVRQSTMPPKSI